MKIKNIVSLILFVCIVISAFVASIAGNMPTSVQQKKLSKIGQKDTVLNIPHYRLSKCPPNFHSIAQKPAIKHLQTESSEYYSDYTDGYSIDYTGIGEVLQKAFRKSVTREQVKIFTLRSSKSTEEEINEWLIEGNKTIISREVVQQSSGTVKIFYHYEEVIKTLADEKSKSVDESLTEEEEIQPAEKNTEEEK